MRSLAFVALMGAIGASGCGADQEAGSRGRIAIDVAPLELAGITDADYVLTLVNGDGDVVWTRALSSTSYGDGAGSLSYVGPCDADAPASTVRLELITLYDADGAVAAETYMNPTPIEREATCVADGDTAVTFDLTIARRAEQGFFDVAVEFEDLFCSGKLDCEQADGSDLELLHDASGARAMTVVLGFACTGRLTGSTPAWLYMDDPVIRCDGLAEDVRVSPTGLGNVDLGAAGNANPGGYLFGAAVYRGLEGLANKAYWNVSFGLDADHIDDFGACRLSVRATASADPFPQEALGFPLPAGSVYPVIAWDVLLSDGGGRQCHRHEVNATDSGVATEYLGYLPILNGFTWAASPVYMQHRFEPGAGVVLTAGGPICNPSCAHGVCSDTDTCDCTGSGYSGALCETPVCSLGCDNGGVCTAPDTCMCLGGFWGDRCENACTAIERCAVPPTCTDASDSVCGACDEGYSGALCDTPVCSLGCDNAGVCVAPDTCMCLGGFWGDRCENVCTAVDHCAVPPTCTDATDSECGACDGGYLEDGAGGCVECLSEADCPDDAETCTIKTCTDGACGQAPGNAGSECRAAVDACDVAESCDGVAPICPADQLAADGAPCGDPTETICDHADSCDGGVCLDNLEPATTVCRADAGDCDVPELCDGAGACPADTLEPDGTACGDATETTCDHADTCDDGVCIDNLEPATTVCRADAGDCDVPELCDGAGACPVDAFEPDGTACPNGLFCDGAETCSAGVCVDQADPCTAGTSVCDEDGDLCDAIYTSCLEALESGETTSGLYYIDPDGAGPDSMFTAYCDLTTAGGGWMLMAKFTQHVPVDQVPLATYQAYFGATGGDLWIEGEAMAVPTSPAYVDDAAFHFESVDWRQHLVTGGRYELRQEFFKATGADHFDVRFRFTYNGHVTQGSAANEWQRAWQLLDRQVVTDTTGIDWDVDPSHALFWLPFKSTATGTLYTACGGYTFAAGGCYSSDPAQRRFGNAGVMGLGFDSDDPAGSWGPHMNTTSPHDIVYVHQASNTVYGKTGAKMALLFWVREERCDAHADCDSGWCDPASDRCAPYQASCLDLYGLGQTADGTYVIDPDGPGGSGVPYATACDMQNGGWTRVAHEDFDSGATSGWSYNGSALSTITTCGGFGHILGGYNVLAAGAALKSYTWAPVIAHTQARLDLEFVQIDSWDSENAYINFTEPSVNPDPSTGAYWHGKNLSPSGGTETCGATNPGWVENLIPVTITIGHTTQEAVVRGYTDLSSAPNDESWGLDDVEVWIR